MRYALKRLFRVLPIMLFAVCCLFATVQDSHADALEDMAWVLDKMGDANPLKSQGIDGNALRDSRGIFVCIEGGKDVLGCADDFSTTPIGSKLADETGIPSWVPMLLHSYTAFKEKDYWGVVYYLGEAALCIAAQVLADGLDVCAILKEIIELASMAINAVWDFLSGLGEAIGEALGGLGCALSICCCDSSDGPVFPFIYMYYFQPKLPEGLKAKEALDQNAYKDYLAWLKKYATDHNTPFFPDPLQIIQQIGFGAADVQLAADSYEQVIRTLWDADMLQRVLPDLGKKRGEYYNNQAILPLLIAGSFKEQNPANYIANTCRDTFNKGQGYEFAQVNRWLATFTKDTDLNKLKQKTKRTDTWCSQEYVGGHKQEILKTYRNYVGSQYCPSVGEKQACTNDDKQKNCQRILGSLGWEDGQRCIKSPCTLTSYGGLSCTSLEDYKSCTAAMGSDANKCGINVSGTGMQIAQKIDAYFKAQGSQFPCLYGVMDFSKGGNNTSLPVEFVCTRPVQQYACKQKYLELVGNQPINFVNCSLNEDPAYTTLRKKVEYFYHAVKLGKLNLNSGAQQPANQSAPSGAKAVYPGNAAGKQVSAVNTNQVNQKPVEVFCSNWISMSAADPLLLTAAECMVNKIKASPNQNLGFGPPSSKPGFDFGTIPIIKIDGASTPVLMIGSPASSVGINPGGIANTYDPGKMTIPAKPGPGPGPDPYEKVTNPGALKNVTTPSVTKTGNMNMLTAPGSGKTSTTVPGANMQKQGY